MSARCCGTQNVQIRNGAPPIRPERRVDQIGGSARVRAGYLPAAGLIGGYRVLMAVTGAGDGRCPVMVVRAIVRGTEVAAHGGSWRDI